MGRPSFPTEHGTVRGYRQHHEMGDPPCTPCLNANRLSVWASRIRNGRVKALNIPLHVLEAVLGGDHEALARFLGPEVVTVIEQWGDTHSVRPEVVASVDATLHKTA